MENLREKNLLIGNSPGHFALLCYFKRRSFVYNLIVFLLLLVSSETYARIPTLDDMEVTATYLNSNGYLDVKMMYYDNDGRDYGLNPSTLYINNTEAAVFKSFEEPGSQQVSKTGPYWLKITPKNDVVFSMHGYTTYTTNPWILQNNITSTIYYGISNTSTIATFRIYPTVDMLKSGKIELRMTMLWDHNEGKDMQLEFSKTFLFTYPKAPILKWDFSTNPGKVKVSATSISGPSTYSFTNQNPVTIDEVKEIFQEYNVSNVSQTIHLNYKRNLSSFQTIDLSSDITVPPYNYPENITATLNENADVVLAWKVSTATNGYVSGGRFDIQRSEDAGFSNPKNVGSVDFLGNGEYSIIDKTSEENINGHYYYRVRRDNVPVWGWSHVVKTDLEISMQHRNIKSARAFMSGESNVSIKWEYDDGIIMSKNTDIMITRINEMKGTSDTYAIPRDSIEGKSYTENLPTTCDTYSYKIYLKPGNSKFDTQEPLKVESENKIYTEYMGKVISFSASKGYFSEHVELEWTTDGKPIDSFSIRARVYGSNSEFKQIDAVENSASKVHQYSDKKALPGVIYEYLIVALTKCGGDTNSAESDVEVGFRTPTGDIYGRVTYESGEAVSDVEVRAEIANSGEDIPNKSYSFESDNTLSIDNTELLKDATEKVTLQAWIKTNSADGNIIEKNGMYTLALENGFAVFKAGAQKLTADSQKVNEGSFVHVSGVESADSLIIYINGRKIKSELKATSVTPNDNNVIIGGNGFVGNIDEVRIWNDALTGSTILRDYSRYITGGENNLKAYFTFNYSVDNMFFDTSYSGIHYNCNHGTVNGATIASQQGDAPSQSELGYKGITTHDGSYTIRSIPYLGNGTTYMIIPLKGTHSFESEKELRLISANSQSHTVNFTDKSSFRVSGKITYKGGTIPVQGVSFKIDGITVMDNKSNIIETAADGSFTISVPVGYHEVKAEKIGHIFENNGKITNSDGTDRNYQDIISGIELFDITKIRYIGRIAGGAVQEAYPVGHSLSKNNLSDGIKLTLTYSNQAYTLALNHDEEVINHLNNKYSTKVEREGNVITVYPDKTTGEFVADVIPESFKVEVFAPGHDKDPINGSGDLVNFSDSYMTQYSVYKYTDENNESRNDSVSFGKKQLFIKRYTPEISIEQIDNSNNVQDYYGIEKINVNTLDRAQAYTAIFYDKEAKKYNIGYPVFEQGTTMTMKIRVSERYRKTYPDGTFIVTMPVDEVPTTDASIDFSSCDLPYGEQALVSVDSIGQATYQFIVNNPELTGALRSFTAKMTYGSSNNSTSIYWPGFKAVVIGSILKGTNFVTGGPDKLISILRDPPGSNSYSYFEKGTTHTTESKYVGSAENEGSEILDSNTGGDVITFAGVGAGTIVETKVVSEEKAGFVHSEFVSGTSSSKTVTTSTTRFQTSSDPLFVGANGDVFLGYSTNISFGATDNISVISRQAYDRAPSNYEIYKSITSEDSEWLLVKSSGLNCSENFSTLFAYPQIYIESTLLPNLEKVRNSFLHFESENIDWQALADKLKEQVYVSKLSKEDKDFGKSNNKKAPNVYDADSYKIYFPSSQSWEKTDTVAFINQSIENWKNLLAYNEETKLNSTFAQNYSFQAGSQIEYSEGYSSTSSHTQSFSIRIGAKVLVNFGVKIKGTGLVLTVDETLTTSHGGEFLQEDEDTNTKGFVLADNGADDYVSVDVMNELSDSKNSGNSEKIEYPNFVFRTKGGATSCPYEDEYVTKYYQPGQHILDAATLKIEVPEISAEKDFIQNVPSGKSANFILYLRNNSQINGDATFDLRIVDDSNPNGAKLYMDGAAIGNGRTIIVPAGQTLIKTLELSKSAVMNYDNIKLALCSQCQSDPTGFIPVIADTVSLSAHFTPAATDVRIKSPSDNWVYNTKLPQKEIDGVSKHYMEIQLDEFDVNYDNFYRIMLQFKPASGSENDWITLMNYYEDRKLYNQAIENGFEADTINSADKGTIKYLWFLDDFPDQKYNLRAVGTSMINNQEILNASKVITGIKDMYNPRLFGSAQPANGVLTINDEIRLNFNETIADGYLTDNNFSVTGIRNGAQTDHSVSVNLDGQNDCMTSEFVRSWNNKSITVELWVNAPHEQDAVYFSHGDANEAFELGITSDNRLKVRIGKQTYTSQDAVPFSSDNWAHVAVVYSNDGYVSAFYNFKEYISNVKTTPYAGSGIYRFGEASDGSSHYKGKMHNARIWDTAVTLGRLQTNSLSKLSGFESNLIAYYPMNEVKGSILKDNACGVNLKMNGCTWSLPAGKDASFNGSDQYVRINTGSSAVIDNTMDYTIEFWFKANQIQGESATLVSSGKGDGTDYGGSKDLFSIGFEGKQLVFRNNSKYQIIDGNYLDNNWHHFALCMNRTKARAQVCMDGVMTSYFESEGFGGIASPYIYIGARGWTPSESAQVTVDNFFKGEIDEFRIWNLYKNETIVSKSYIERLDGKEKGLLAYYPFEKYIEWQGTQELKFTLSDMKVQKDAMVVPDGEMFGSGSVEAVASAPVCDKGPVAKLMYDFVVNNDALIITLKESPDRIEKTIVDLTVEGVRDVNGNELISPITWSVFVTRNQVKWGEDNLSISMPEGSEKKFTVNVVNNGGSIQHFYIENLPSWLSASVTSGSINPVSSIPVEFTIDAGVNVGSYDEVLYLRDDNNILEPLPVNVKVNASKPEWSVNPSDYQYNMSIIGQLKIDNLYSTDNEDILAAFDNGKCVGIVNNAYSKAGEMYYVMITVYSNSVTSDDLEFRIWDASTGNIYQASTENKISFVSNKIVGSYIKPIIFTAQDSHIQNINLTPGWNWISFNVINDALSSINKIMHNNDWSEQDIIKSEQDNTFSLFVKQKGWTGSLSGFDNTHMYLVKSEKAQTIELIGPNVDVKNNQIKIIGKSYDGKAYWSYISYLPSIKLPLKEALAGYEAAEGDILKTINGFAIYSEKLGWLGSLSYMESGRGYMLQRNAVGDAMLQYPEITSLRARAMTRVNDVGEDNVIQSYINTDYDGNMTIVAKVKGIDINSEDELVAYIDGERRAQAKAINDPQNGELIYFISVSGDNGIIDFTIENNGRSVAKSTNTIGFANNILVGSLDKPQIIDFSSEVNENAVFPSPFNDVLYIRYNAETSSSADVSIVDIQGKVVARFDDCCNNGIIDITWKDTQLLPAGIYIVNIKVDGKNNVYKVIKE